MSRLQTEAQEILKLNDHGNHTVPSRHLYPHMWAWDSAFAALGWSTFDKDRGLTELEYLMSVAFEDGRIPHIHFNQDGLGEYFPGPKDWGKNDSSTITQPPVWGLIALKMYERGCDPVRIRKLLPAIEKSHQFFLKERDPKGWNLVAIAHPWESGLDNAPCWDPPMEEIDPNLSPEFKRVDVDRVDDPSQRPSDLEYKRYMAIVESIKCARFSMGLFSVYDPMMSVALALSEKALAELSEKLGVSSQARERYDNMVQALEERLWNQERSQYQFYNTRSETAYCSEVIGSYWPLLLEEVPSDRREKMVEELKSNYFLEYGLTTASSKSTFFQKQCYWRGPVWIVMNWFFKDHFGETLQKASEALLEKSGFREYFDPVTGQGLGAEKFTWSAALYLDMITEK